MACKGPLPRGTYIVGSLGSHGKVGLNSMFLDPTYATAQKILSLHRTPYEFYMHANAFNKLPSSSSEGCIVICHAARMFVGNGIAKILEVMR